MFVYGLQGYGHGRDLGLVPTPGANVELDDAGIVLFLVHGEDGAKTAQSKTIKRWQVFQLSEISQVRVRDGASLGPLSGNVHEGRL